MDIYLTYDILKNNGFKYDFNTETLTLSKNGYDVILSPEYTIAGSNITVFNLTCNNNDQTITITNIKTIKDLSTYLKNIFDIDIKFKI